MADIETVRKVIEEAVARFFRRKILIDERMYQVLELTDEERRYPPSSISLLASALRFQPSIASAMSDVGVSVLDTDAPDLPSFPYDVLPEVDNFVYQFEAWFRHIDKSRKPATQAYSRVRETGRLTVMDAIQGCLEARYLDDRYNDRNAKYGGRVSVNDLVGFLSEKRLGTDTVSNRQMERQITDLCQQLISQLGQVEKADPDVGNPQFILYYDGRGFRIRPFGTWNINQLKGSELADGSLWISRGNVLQPLTHFGHDALMELEELINSDLPEQRFQTFFERHPQFLTTLGNYRTLHPQLILSEERGNRLVPDFFLEKIDSDLCDICDLKRPTQELVRYQANRVRFRDAVQEAVAQLTLYRDFFEDRTNRTAFRAKYGLSAYRPQVVIIIGRARSFYQEVDRIKLEAGLPNWVQLKTYDDVVARARQWIKFASVVPDGILGYSTGKSAIKGR